MSPTAWRARVRRPQPWSSGGTMSAETPTPLPNDRTIARADSRTSRTALRFVLLIGVLSFFADFTYEGSRSILGPFLALLGASGTVVGVVTGFGELLGYGLRLVSGRLADATRQYWPITIFGYVVQMASVPALALVDRGHLHHITKNEIGRAHV